MNKYRLIAWFGIVWGILFCPARVQASSQYRVVGLPGFYPTDINSRGQIVGNYEISFNDYYPAILLPGAYAATPIDIGLRHVGWSGEPARINEFGQVVTESRFGEKAFWTPWESNGATGYVTSLSGDVIGEAYDPNDELEFPWISDVGDDGSLIGAGWDFDHGGGYKSYFWKPSTANGSAGAYSVFAGGNGATVRLVAINSRGNVVGNDDDGPFLFVPTDPYGLAGVKQPVELGPIGPFGGATNINDVGQVVGNITVGNRFHVALWNPSSANGASGVALDLGTLAGRFQSYAVDVNNVGVVVGYANDDKPGSESTDNKLNGLAFVWTPNNGMQNLVDLVDASGSGWKFYSVSGINDRGQIVGMGFYDPDGEGGVPPVKRGFVMNPVPEPTTLGLGLTAVMGWTLRRLWRPL